ncbi:MULTISPECIES: TIGR02808 family protein [unclassified Colwellia]|nr:MULTISPECIES: TIGR02808 family protein [unclassified Colwellia]MBA6230836.1 TIGR02808 family protein [Colwellia sp. MB02u-7]MBA6234767.1 TIGR02808 family protein [Colwellia sp. MB02u-11]MBA6255630.1 TIGR02808 family protein [Colwellia sp. MB3u-28]MBA6261771.1 TIGR02808 family protein [Colwellia sp. MB3u-41]MBA6301322.1 TIGR02808 family protein [Colwellia sp. MB3u-22]
MSALEQMIWNILGYSSMPVIFLAGFAGTALVAVALLKMLGVKSVGEK